MNQATFARKVGASQSNVSQWLNDGSIPKPASIAKIADALGLDYNEVMRRSGRIPPDESPTPEPVVDSDLLRKLERLARWPDDLAAVDYLAQRFLELREPQTPYEATPPPAPSPPVESSLASRRRPLRETPP